MDSPDQQASSGYTTEKLAMTDLGDFLNNEMEYTQDLDTEDKKISGALNELHGIDGFDVYDETTTSANKYEQGDICIHNNTLQVCTDAAGAYGAWDSTKWSPTTIKALLALKQNSTDNSLTTTNKQIVPAINEVRNYNNLINKPTIPTKTSDLTNDSRFTVATTVSWGTSITINYIKSNFLLFASNQLFVLWFYGGGYVNVDIRNIGTNDVASGSGTATLGSITVKRTSDGFTATITGNATLTVIG